MVQPWNWYVYANHSMMTKLCHLTSCLRLADFNYFRERLGDKGSSVQSLSCVWLFVTPWTAARQAPCLSPTPGVYWNSCPSSKWCHPTILSSLIPFSSCLQSFLSENLIMGDPGPQSDYFRDPPKLALKLQIICISSRLPCPSGIIRMKSDHKTNIPWPDSTGWVITPKALPLSKVAH